MPPVIDDTVFALASGAGRAAVAVLRLSGPGTAAIVRALAGALPAPRQASLRRLRHPHSAEVLDQALVLWFPGPRSYTGEDSAELHLHGGPAVIAGVAEALVAAGARPAEPGEFTRRAFVHGRLDLTAAEGIADLIAAETAAQRRQALRQAEGALATLYGGWAARITALLARQEAFIEFEDEDLPEGLDDAVAGAAAALRAEIASHLADAHRGERLREGLLVAILGAPNAGKSSLLNALAGREAAIVSARAGTTRDVVEVRLDLAGVPVTLADTAGLREAEDEIEVEGIRRARRRAEEADLVLAVFAADQAPDAGTLDWVRPGTLVVVNKRDLALAPATIGGLAPIPVSAVTGEGLNALRARLAEEATARAGLGAEATLTRPRHRAALTEAAGWLAEIAVAPLPELRAEALRAALRAIGRITGRVGVEAVLDLVFGEFCIGK
ncbi:tRNA uridine-5-carboxymethylaminomethyl(34) synthesis GTPase MnmE [Paracraurococcus ruber]|uniref:tRNA modification GTPase MnmE n=1 Tax=Paracraurococcus ruber TaxID=77675 RepID=A0ABS1CY70_9PROT|nr:tRNA uridine-5-carboxymethylaminomethyl(34) synthesis GTPase MnmE [Paracraurococcus ruber]MBK1659486.1 tRNA uridine-5-carboxymethylaminomethyl(34) synthesis GTPase MnmE [Paracraurococcus ruber]TDG33641.1 tRNA uridine-5-carboxymethylaminomethyl(34) synthesis GTPase MnmE [Paracraurococcus ruber]